MIRVVPSANEIFTDIRPVIRIFPLFVFKKILLYEELRFVGECYLRLKPKEAPPLVHGEKYEMIL
jgi:hypothetical protein